MTFTSIGLLGPPTNCVLDSPISLESADIMEAEVVTEMFVLEEMGTITTLFQFGCFFSHSGSMSSPWM